ncbi:hypothetical protein TSOC_005775 [Tetrabaena socialis]|uniref:Uncharacterized protein n=1 Tax=Tetrabaena socialis TaxID=47790 RepID=A0A2J8A5I2_9CHLO|nr:hypothetical protein TSOC_005775 [Tetrabaena socialis]|eukprot:PNH07757.1 hypothetical protein TSOC_005775 [Tetrabaena socialis]
MLGPPEGHKKGHNKQQYPLPQRASGPNHARPGGHPAAVLRQKALRAIAFGGAALAGGEQ